MRLRVEWVAGIGGGLGAVVGVALADIIGGAGWTAQAIVALCAGVGALIGYYVGQQVRS